MDTVYQRTLSAIQDKISDDYGVTLIGLSLSLDYLPSTGSYKVLESLKLEDLFCGLKR